MDGASVAATKWQLITINLQLTTRRRPKDSQQIDAFIAHSRQVAAVQKQRWQGVDPTRLEQACDIIDLLRRQLAGAQLAGGYAAPYASQEAAARALEVWKLNSRISTPTISMVLICGT